MDRSFLRPGRIFALFAILVWTVMMGALIKKTYLPSPGLGSAWRVGSGEGIEAGETWMGIYLNDRKIGYAVSRWEKEDLDWRVVERVVMELVVMGRPQPVRISTSTLLDPSCQLKSFHFHLSAGETEFGAEGQAAGRGKDLVVRLSGLGEDKEVRIRGRQGPLLWANLRFLFRNRSLREGDRIQVSLLDPATLQVEGVELGVEGRERIKVGEKEIEAFRLKANFKGIVVRSWIDEKGEIWKEESPLGFTLVREDKETALLKGRGTGRAEDLLALAAVSSPVRFADPGSISVLRLRLVNLPGPGFDLDGGRQRLRDGTLEIRREEFDFTAPTLPLRSAKLLPYLEATPFIQTGHPELRAQALAVLQGEVNALAAARKLAAWVYENIEKRPTLSFPSALEVLHRRVGDCNEHTTLYAGLARSVGLPTKIAAGLIYQKGRFYYHAWPEVFVGRWVAIDPTLNQFPADATHIRLVEGGLERQAELIKLMGSLSLDILGYR